MKVAASGSVSSVRHFPGFSLFNGDAENFQIVPEAMNFNVRVLS